MVWLKYILPAKESKKSALSESTCSNSRISAILFMLEAILVCKETETATPYV